jgi:hypothetical protein
MVRRAKYPEPQLLGILNGLGGWWPYFFPLYYLWLIVLIAARLRQRNIGDPTRLIEAVRARELLDLELLLLGAAVGLAPGLLSDMDRSDFFYLSSFPRWLAIGLLLSMQGVADGKGEAASRFPPLQRLGWDAVLACMLVAELARIVPSFAEFRQRTEGYAATIRQQRSAQSATMMLARRLEELAQLPQSIKRHSFVYVPRSNREYWNLHAENYPDTAMFFVPAVTGMAMLYGIDDSAAARQRHAAGHYSFSHYTIPSGGQPVIDLCGRSRAFRGTRVFVLDPDATRTLDCPR